MLPLTRWILIKWPDQGTVQRTAKSQFHCHFWNSVISKVDYHRMTRSHDQVTWLGHMICLCLNHRCSSIHWWWFLLNTFIHDYCFRSYLLCFLYRLSLSVQSFMILAGWLLISNWPISWSTDWSIISNSWTKSSGAWCMLVAQVNRISTYASVSKLSFMDFKIHFKFILQLPWPTLMR